MSHALEIFGRLHPLVLHLPIGMLLGALVLELFASRAMVDRAALGFYLRIAALSALLAAGAGWVLSREDGYGGDVVARHQRLGLALTGLALMAALVHDSSGRSTLRIGIYRVFLVASCLLLLPAGHLGSTITHGEDWLEGPGAEPRVRQVPVAEREAAGSAAEKSAPEGGAAARDTAEKSTKNNPAPVATAEAAQAANATETYADVAPILEQRCTTCHGEKKHKGHLRLDTPQGMLAGGESGPALVPGNVEESLFLKRALLPAEHEDHMPPEGKPQPTADELAVLQRWVAAGAPFGASAADVPKTGAPKAGALVKSAVPASAQTAQAERAAAQARQDALAALDAAFVHHEPVRAGADELVIDVAAVAPSFGDAELERLVLPLKDEVAVLSLARSAVSDASLPELASFPALTRLDLRATKVTDAGLAALAGHAALQELVLAQTKLSDAAVETLLSLPKLAKVAVWNAGLSTAAIARLRARPGLVVNAGDEPPAEALQSEGELAFTSDRPLPGAELLPAGLRPVNATCPVSGNPVNPKYAVLHEGKVIGFCCPNCPKEFWADPAKFAAKLP